MSQQEMLAALHCCARYKSVTTSSGARVRRAVAAGPAQSDSLDNTAYTSTSHFFTNNYTSTNPASCLMRKGYTFALSNRVDTNFPACRQPTTTSFMVSA
jgi:hypothetical protein